MLEAIWKQIAYQEDLADIAEYEKEKEKGTLTTVSWQELKSSMHISAVQLTENGYPPEFEAEVLRTSEEYYATIKNGTAKPYNNTAEMFAEWDNEDDG